MEKDLSRMLMRKMAHYGHFSRIENMVEVGTPDVSYCIRGVEGFIENKWRARWPARAEDVVTFAHFTPQQRLWHKIRAKAGGRTFILLEVERPAPSYFLLAGLWAAEALAKTATRADIEAHALASGVGRFPEADLVRALIAPR